LPTFLSKDSPFVEFRDFAEFWSTENLDRLNAYGSDKHAPFRFEARRATLKGKERVVIRYGSSELRAELPSLIFDLDRDWKQFTYKQR